MRHGLYRVEWGDSVGFEQCHKGRIVKDFSKEIYLINDSPELWLGIWHLKVELSSADKAGEKLVGRSLEGT